MAAKRKSAKGKLDGDRDKAGRFIRGNRIGRDGGNPNLKRLAEYQRAVREAIEPSDLVNVMRRLRDIALDTSQQPSDSIAASRVLLERCMGKPESPSKVVDTELEVVELHSIDDIGRAGAEVLKAMMAGSLDLQSGASLIQSMVIVAAREMDAEELREGAGMA